jgi:hypothetical protein
VKIRILVIISLVLMMIAGCGDKQKHHQGLQQVSPVAGTTSVHADVEQTARDTNYILTSDSLVTVYASGQRTDSIAHSGRYALKLTSERPYGFTIDVDRIKKNEIIQAECWCFGFKPMLVAGDSGNVFYRITDQVIETDSGGWKKISMKFPAPGNLHNHSLRIFVWNYKGEQGYVDDFSFERKPPVQRNIEPEMLLKIVVSPSGMSKLNSKRKEAFSKGVLDTDDGDYVKARLIYMGDTLKGSLRLKGDWLDHLQGDKWSFRVKLKSAYAWKGMRTFSLQTPESRSFLDEWLLHRLLKKEDVLTTRYGFINVDLNGQDMGVYAYEEHFDKQLIECNNRREGPIVKFSEETFWYFNQLNLNSDKLLELPTYKESPVLPFKDNALVKSPVLLKEFENAQNLMVMYRKWKYPLGIMFDVDKLARYLALIDITRGYHGIGWHNQRFYFNPVTCTLEPIAFDCYTSEDNHFHGDFTILGDILHPERMDGSPSSFYNQYFNDSVFRSLYFGYMKKYSDEPYIRQFLNESEPEIRKAEALIREEFFYYQFSDTFLFRNAQRVHGYLENKTDQLIQKDPSAELKGGCKPVVYDVINSPQAPPKYINAYSQGTKDQQTEKVKIVNNYSLDISIVGYADSSGTNHYFSQQYIVKSINAGNNKRDIDIPVGCKALLYKSGPFTEMFKLNIFKWKYPEEYSPRQELVKAKPSLFLTKYSRDRVLTIPAGKYEITEPLIIPENYTVEIKAGAILNFTRRSFLMSFTAVNVMGDVRNPVIITSSDGSSMGFIVLQTKDKSTLSHMVFSQLNCLDYKGWSLTGATTFYESDVDMEDVKFCDNVSEDALNIIRSEFHIKNCRFKNIYGDAFDSDFSKGVVEYTDFEDIRNDAADLSGSLITMRYCTVKNAKDKGVSGGEASDVKLENCRISNVNIGVASKDNSKVEFTHSWIESSEYGLVTFTKKSEYAGAFLKADHVTLKEIRIPTLIEKESVFIQDGKYLPATEESVAKLFY